MPVPLAVGCQYAVEPEPSQQALLFLSKAALDAPSCSVSGRAAGAWAASLEPAASLCSAVCVLPAPAPGWCVPPPPLDGHYSSITDASAHPCDLLVQLPA